MTVLVYVALAAVGLWYSSELVGWPFALHACGLFIVSSAAMKLQTLDELHVPPFWQTEAGIAVLRVAVQLWLIPLVTGLIWVHWWAGLAALALAFPVNLVARIFVPLWIQLLAGLTVGVAGLVWLMF
jgi:hypothetical protein